MGPVEIAEHPFLRRNESRSPTPFPSFLRRVIDYPLRVGGRVAYEVTDDNRKRLIDALISHFFDAADLRSREAQVEFIHHTIASRRCAATTSGRAS